MEDRDRISDNEIAREDEESVTHGEYESSEQDAPAPRRRKHWIHLEGTKEKEEREKREEKEEREKKTADERVEDMEKAVRGFRIATSGDGFLRGKFGRLPPNVESLMERMKNLSNAMSKFQMEGDNLNISGSFDKGYTVTRENPCEQQQVNQGPT